MPDLDIIRLGELDADRRLASAFDQLIGHFDVPLPDIPEPTLGASRDWQRVERTRGLAVRAEAILEHLRRPITA